MTKESTDLHAEALFTADHAAVHDGKLYVNGGFWSRLNFASFPVVHTFSIGLVVHIPWRKNPHTYPFAISFEDADGQPTANRLEGNFQTSTSPELQSGEVTEVPM